MLYSSYSKTNNFIKKLWGDLLITIITYIAGWVSSTKECILGICIKNGYIRVPVYFVILFLIIVLIRFIYGLLEFKLFGAEVEYVTNERERFSDLNNMRMEKSIKLLIKNTRKNQIIDCFVTLEEIKKIFTFDKNRTTQEQAYKLWNEIESKNIGTRLRWVKKNISNQNCMMTIPGCSESEIEIARFDMHKGNLLTGYYFLPSKIYFNFCNIEENQFCDELGIYSLKMIINGTREGKDYHEDFLGYLYVDIEQENHEQGFYIVTKFRRGNPFKDKEIKKLLINYPES